MIRILIVSRTPWDDSNSFGNTFSNLFGGMEGVEIYNICCQTGDNNNNIVKAAYQMTDTSVLKSLKGEQSGHKMWQQAQQKISEQTEICFPRQRLTIFYICREILWKIGRWKSKSLENFIKDIKPDFLYLPIYHSGYVCDVQLFAIRKSHVPYCVHITDDVYTHPPTPLLTPLKSLYHLWVSRKIRQLIKSARYGEAFAESMVEEYPRNYGIPFYLIGKGIAPTSMPRKITLEQDLSEMNFVYTGNYGGERGQQLVILAKEINNHLIRRDKKAVFSIYSNTVVEDKIKTALSQYSFVKLYKGVDSVQVYKIQKNANFLIHVEGFSKKAIAETRMSFSTKLIDYMSTMKPIIAIGPSNINSIEVLKRYGLAYIATNRAEIGAILDRIMDRNLQEERKIQQNVIAYLNSYRNLNTIQKSIYERLKSTLENAHA